MPLGFRSSQPSLPRTDANFGIGALAEWNPTEVIAESTTVMKRISVSEAVMELDLTGTPMVVFRHAGYGRVNLVYRRADGHIGGIDPPTMEKDAH